MVWLDATTCLKDGKLIYLWIDCIFIISDLDYENDDSGLLQTLLPANQLGIDEIVGVTENPITVKKFFSN